MCVVLRKGRCYSKKLNEIYSEHFGYASGNLRYFYQKIEGNVKNKAIINFELQ